MRRRWVLLLGSAVVALGGCATLPTGPSVMVLPAPGKSFEQFQAEDAVCRQWAAQQVGPPGAPATQKTAVGAAVGTAIGAGLGAGLGALAGHAGTGAAIGAGTGLLTGAAAGANADQAAGMECAAPVRHGVPAVHVREGQPDPRCGARDPATCPAPTPTASSAGLLTGTSRTAAIPLGTAAPASGPITLEREGSRSSPGKSTLWWHQPPSSFPPKSFMIRSIQEDRIEFSGTTPLFTRPVRVSISPSLLSTPGSGRDASLRAGKSPAGETERGIGAYYTTEVDVPSTYGGENRGIHQERSNA